MKTTLQITCLGCNNSLEKPPHHSFLGFRKYHCPHCNVETLYPLDTGTFVFYLLLLGAGIILALGTGQIPIPGLLGIAVIYALVKNYGLPKKIGLKNNSVLPQLRKNTSSLRAFFRFKNTNMALENIWWHRLVKVGIWLVTIAVFISGLSGLDSSARHEADALSTMFLGAPVTYFVLKLLYYRIVLYIVYGKNLPQKSAIS